MTSFCSWCGSSRHESDNCPTRNLLKHLTREEYSGKLPDIIVVVDEANLINTVEEAHAFQHLKKKREEA